MPASLETIGRSLVRILLAVFTAVVLLLVQSAFWSNAVSMPMRLIIVSVALVAYFRPQYGLLVIAAIAPLGQVMSRTLDSQMRGAEALVLAFLAGALVRGWTLKEFRSFPSTRLDFAAVIFSLVVAASCVEQIWFTQIQRDFPGPFVSSLLDYSTHNYVSSFRGFGMVFYALLLIEGAALLVYASHLSQQLREFAGRLAIALVTGGIAAAFVNFWYFAQAARQTADTPAAALQLLTAQRWTAFVGDVNAGGSMFAMTMFLAIGAGVVDKSHRLVWMVAGLAAGVALWMTASRTAIVAVVMMAAVLTAVVMLKRFRRRWLAGVVAIACVLTFGAAIWRFYPSQFTGLSASDAVTIRWLFLRTTAHMLEKEPLFGVGIGQYGLWSSEYAPPELFKFYASENAHNNFAQVAGELGLVGLAAFLFLLVASLMRGKRTSQMLPVLLMPAISASAVFVLTWLGGHPLLVPEVSYPFWLTLGLGAGLLAAESRVRVSSAMVGIVFAVLLTSIPFRIHHKTASLDMTRIRYGISDKGMMGPRGRLFVPAEQSHIDLPLRSRMATQQSPIEIDVLVEDRVVDTITMVDDKWLTRRIPLPGGGNHAQQIDLRLRRPELPDDDEAPARRSWVEIGDWSIISKPNG